MLKLIIIISLLMVSLLRFNNCLENNNGLYFKLRLYMNMNENSMIEISYPKYYPTIESSLINVQASIFLNNEMIDTLALIKKEEDPQIIFYELKIKDCIGDYILEIDTFDIYRTTLIDKHSFNFNPSWFCNQRNLSNDCYCKEKINDDDDDFQINEKNNVIKQICENVFPLKLVKRYLPTNKLLWGIEIEPIIPDFLCLSSNVSKIALMKDYTIYSPLSYSESKNIFISITDPGKYQLSLLDHHSQTLISRPIIITKEEISPINLQISDFPCNELIHVHLDVERYPLFDTDNNAYATFHSTVSNNNNLTTAIMLFIDDNEDSLNKWVMQSSLTFKLKPNTKYQARFAFWNSTFMCLEDSVQLLTPSSLIIEPILPLQLIQCPERFIFLSVIYSTDLISELPIPYIKNEKSTPVHLISSSFLTSDDYEKDSLNTKIIKYAIPTIESFSSSIFDLIYDFPDATNSYTLHLDISNIFVRKEFYLKHSIGSDYDDKKEEIELFQTIYKSPFDQYIFNDTPFNPIYDKFVKTRLFGYSSSQSSFLSISLLPGICSNYTIKANPILSIYPIDNIEDYLPFLTETQEQKQTKSSLLCPDQSFRYFNVHQPRKYINLVTKFGILTDGEIIKIPSNVDLSQLMAEIFIKDQQQTGLYIHVSILSSHTISSSPYYEQPSLSLYPWTINNRIINVLTLQSRINSIKVTSTNPDYSISLVSTPRDSFIEHTAYIDLETVISMTDLIFKAEYIYDNCSTFKTFSIPQPSESALSPQPPWTNFISDDYMICPSISTNIIRRFFIPSHISDQFPRLTIWNNETFDRTEVPKVVFRSPGTYIIQYDPRNYKTPVYRYTIHEPPYSDNDFIHKIISFPSCDNSADGIVWFTIPKYLSQRNVQIDARFSNCKTQFDVLVDPSRPFESACNKITFVRRGGKEEEEEEGIIEIRNLPYLISLTVEFGIDGDSCHVSKEIVLEQTMPSLSRLKIEVTDVNLDKNTNKYLVDFHFPLMDSVIIRNEDKSKIIEYKDGNYRVFGDDKFPICCVNVTQMIGKCEYNESVTIERPNDALMTKTILKNKIYPSIRIDREKSIEPFCVGEADGILYASFDDGALAKKYSRRMSIEWEKDGQKIAAVSKGAMRLGYVFLPDSVEVGTGEYTVILRVHGEGENSDVIEWTSKDSIRTIVKNRYVVESLMNVQLDGSVELLESKTVKNKEFTFFSPTMLSSEDRNAGYLKGSNLLKLTGIPSGKTIKIGINRPTNHPVAEECKTKLSITIPTFIESLPSIYTPMEHYEYGVWKDRNVRKIIYNAKTEQNLQSQLENLHFNLNLDDYVLSKDLLFSSSPPPRTIMKRDKEEEEQETPQILIQPDNILMPPSFSNPSRHNSLHSKTGKYNIYVKNVQLEDLPHMRIRITELKWSAIPSSDHILTLSDDPYWPFVCTIKAESSRKFEVSLIDSRMDNKKRTQDTTTITVDTFDMTPVHVVCNIGLLPSSIYSYDGTLQITMTGGQPPYFILWADLAEAVYFNNTPQYTNTYTYTRTQVGIGIYYATIIDSLFQLANSSGLTSCSFTVYSNLDPTLRVSLVDTSLPSGCYSQTRSLVTVALSTGGNAGIPTVTGIGTWEINTQSPITSCSDGRMRAVNITNPDLTVYISVGEWRVALCLVGTTIISTPQVATSYAILNNETVPLSVFNVTDGQTCTVNGSVTKVEATFEIEYPFVEPLVVMDGDVVLNAQVTVFVDDAMSKVRILRENNLTTGEHTIIIYDARNCARTQMIEMVDTGYAQCGNCNISDFSCVDECGVPFGNNTCLYDCIIDNQVADPVYIAFEIENCVNNGTSVYATGNADPIYFDLLFSNISKVNMSNFKWINDASVALLPMNASCPSNATFGNIWFYNFYLLIGGVTLNVPKCNYAVLSFSNLTSQIFTHATNGGEPFLTLNMTSSQTSVVTFALYNTPLLPTLIVEGVSGVGNLNFTFDVYSQILLLSFEGYTNKSKNSNVTLACYYFEHYPTYIEYIAVNGGVPISVDDALATICASTGVSVHKSLRKNVVINAYIVFPIVFVGYGLLAFFFLYMFDKMKIPTIYEEFKKEMGRI